MKFNLKMKDTVKVGNRFEERYLYEDESKSVLVQFFAGKKPWTFEIDLATNEAGKQIAEKLINVWCQQGISAFKDGQTLDEATEILEVK